MYFLEGRGFVQQVDDDGHPAEQKLIAQAGETIVTPRGVWHHHGAVEGQDAVHLSITRDVPKNDANWRYGQFLPPDLPRESDDDRLL